MVDEDEGQTPLLIVHSKTLVPLAMAVTELVAKVGFETDAVPLITVHDPVPIAGLFPVRFVVGLLAQSVWLTPALAVVGTASRVIETVEEEEGQIPFPIVH